MALALLQQFLRQATGGFSRSTALAPLQLPFGLCATAALVSVTLPATPPWLTISFAAAGGVLGFALVGGFFFFAVKDPVLLRSERFTIRKLELEGRVGDSNRGLEEPSPLEAQVVETEATQLPSPDEDSDE
jgi:hypothetical protein